MTFQMQTLVDLHTHTCASTHAFSTLAENVAIAKKKGLELIAVTDHAPALPDAPHIWHFNTLRQLPREIDGVKLLFGIESSVLDVDGHIDVPEYLQKSLDVIIASIHEPLYPSRNVQEHTETWLNVIQNPYVDIIGHSGNPSYCYEIEPVVRAAKAAGVCIEINNHSFATRKGSAENCRKIAEMCKKNGAPIVVNSDAHSCFEIGEHATALHMLSEIDFPEELVMNTCAEKFINYIEKRKGRVMFA